MQLTPAWKEMVRVKLRELGHDHRWLEDQLKVSRGAVTRMLADAQQTSKLVADACRILDLPMPVAVVGGADEHEAIALYRRLSPRHQRYVLQTMEMLRGEEPD